MQKHTVCYQSSLYFQLMKPSLHSVLNWMLGHDDQILDQLACYPINVHIHCEYVMRYYVEVSLYEAQHQLLLNWMLVSLVLVVWCTIGQHCFFRTGNWKTYFVHCTNLDYFGLYFNQFGNWDLKEKDK